MTTKKKWNGKFVPFKFEVTHKGKWRKFGCKWFKSEISNENEVEYNKEQYLTEYLTEKEEKNGKWVKNGKDKEIIFQILPGIFFEAGNFLNLKWICVRKKE